MNWMTKNSFFFNKQPNKSKKNKKVKQLVIKEEDELKSEITLEEVNKQIDALLKYNCIN